MSGTGSVGDSATSLDFVGIRDYVGATSEEIRVREETAARLREMAEREEHECDRLRSQLETFAGIMIENASAKQLDEILTLFTELGLGSDYDFQ